MNNASHVVSKGAQCAPYGYYKTWAMGGDRDDVLGAMIEAGATTVIATSGNQVIGGIANGYANVAAHAVFGCASATMGGGKCGAGAISGAITAGADRIDTGNFWSGLALAMAAGCGGSAAGGGSCADGITSSAFIYLYNANGAYNAKDDRYVGPGTPEDVLYGTGNRRITWSGEYIDSLEVSIAINAFLPGRFAKLMPDVDIVIKVETGYNEYEYRVAIQNFQVVIHGQRVVSRVPTNQEMTNRYIWQRERADATVHTRRVLGD